MILDEALAIATEALRAKGYSERQARAIVDTVTAAERDECISHGLFRIPFHVKTLRDAVEVRLADIGSGRFADFESSDGPHVPGVRKREDTGGGLMTLAFVYAKLRRTSAVTNAGTNPTIHSSKSRLALIAAMSLSYRAADFATPRALVSSALALTSASQTSLFIVLRGLHAYGWGLYT